MCKALVKHEAWSLRPQNHVKWNSRNHSLHSSTKEAQTGDPWSKLLASLDKLLVHLRDPVWINQVESNWNTQYQPAAFTHIYTYMHSTHVSMCIHSTYISKRNLSMTVIDAFISDPHFWTLNSKTELTICQGLQKESWQYHHLPSHRVLYCVILCPQLYWATEIKNCTLMLKITTYFG